MDTRKNVDAVLEILAKELPPLVTRETIYEKTGGSVSIYCLRRLDQQGRGPEGKVIMGRQAVYPRDKVLEFLRTWMSPPVKGGDLKTYHRRKREARRQRG